MFFTLAIMALLMVIHTYLARATRNVVVCKIDSSDWEPEATFKRGGAEGNSRKRQHPTDKVGKKINRVGIGVVAAAILTFNVAFWAVAIREYSRIPEDYLN